MTPPLTIGPSFVTVISYLAAEICIYTQTFMQYFNKLTNDAPEQNIKYKFVYKHTVFSKCLRIH